MSRQATAATYSEYGEPEDVLRIETVEVGDPEPGQVRVRVHTTAVNPIDWKIRSGMFAGGKPLGRTTLTGRDLAGVIDAVGPDVTGLAVGDRVAGNVGGASAEYVLVKASEVTPLPDTVDDLVGGALGVAGTTAIRVLGLAGVHAGSVVLIHGATGGTGVFTTQLAIARGARVVGTTGPANQDFLQSLGATAIEYGDGWEERARAQSPDGYDAALDLTGHGVIEGSQRLVKAGGKVVTIADYGAKGDNVILTRGGEPGFENALAEVVAAVADGTVTVPIERTFPLADIAEAHRLSRAGHVRGKLVVVLD